MTKGDILKKELNYYSRVYSPKCKKVKELKKKLSEIKKNRKSALS